MCVCVCVMVQVKPFTPREFTCAGMLERLQAYITHQVSQDQYNQWNTHDTQHLKRPPVSRLHHLITR